MQGGRKRKQKGRERKTGGKRSRTQLRSKGTKTGTKGDLKEGLKRGGTLKKIALPCIVDTCCNFVACGAGETHGLPNFGCGPLWWQDGLKIDRWGNKAPAEVENPSEFLGKGIVWVNSSLTETLRNSIMAVHLGKYSQSLCTSAQKYMLCAKIFVVLRRNKVTAQKC
jgi:hypothetical protein